MCCEIGSKIVYRRGLVAWLLWLVAAAGHGAELTEEQVVAVMGPYEGPSVTGVDATTLVGKVMCGYQGWFTAEGDGAGRGWMHYRRGRNFEPGSCCIDLWPDVSELDEDEKYATPFRHADGSVAYVFSSMNRKTVVRHFKWMEDYGIDGAFVQRFTPRPGDTKQLHHATTVLDHCREGANRHGRVYALMYDMHFDAEAIDHMRQDWKRLVDRMQITADAAYVRHRGKPVLALWGCGFPHRGWDPDAIKDLIHFLQNDPKYGGLTVMLGVPAWWRTFGEDSRDDERLHEVMLAADIVCPWSVGRFRRLEDVAHHAEIRLKPDLQWCQEHGKDYVPVVFPGFSWNNMRPGTALDLTPRRSGKFLWRQCVEAKQAGATMIYLAMFDEMDEGTAIFKCTSDPPVGPSKFLTFDGLASDHYLWLAGTCGRLLRGEIEPTEEPPERVTDAEDAQ